MTTVVEKRNPGRKITLKLQSRLSFPKIESEKKNKWCVFIGNLNKIELLRALWHEAAPLEKYMFQDTPPPPFDEREAAIAVFSFIDVFCGVPIVTDLSGDWADPRAYDVANYRFMGRFAKCVHSLSEK